MKWYARENTGAILSEKQYANVPHHNPAVDNYGYVGEFATRAEAREASKAIIKKWREQNEQRSI